MPEQLDSNSPTEENSGASPRRPTGKLKIFLGYATGVGKQQAMLRTAQQRLREGHDVVAAYLDVQRPAQTEELLAGIELVTGSNRPSRGGPGAIIDLDALLARQPALALIDDLAQDNAPGSRHARRYQDVLELLNGGIDVYTTLNVQHLESLNDVVAQITGVVVRRTLPDWILDQADEIELVDLPIDELLQRIREGRLSILEQGERDTREFFRPGNLTALRELAFRQAADHVDERMRAYMQDHGILSPWPAHERLLVCVSPSPLSERLVRSAKRLASRLNADWFCVYVETPRHANLAAAERDRLTHTLLLAEELGARSISLPGRSVADTISSYAQTHNITKIIAGKPLQPRWKERLRGSIVDQIVRRSRHVDVYVISGSSGEKAAPAAYPFLQAGEQIGQRALYATALVGLVTLLGLPLRPFIEPTNLAMLYLLAVILAAIRLGRDPAILASLLGVIAFDLIFVPPYYTFGVADAQYLLTFAALLGVSLVISALTAQAQEQAQAAQRREAHTALLYELSRDLAAAPELQDVAQTVVTHVQKILGGKAAVFVHDGERLSLYNASEGYRSDEREMAAADWTYGQAHSAGRSTSALGDAEGFYLPLKTARDVVGVLGVSLPDQEGGMTPEQRRLFESFASQVALAIERSLLAERAKQAQLLQETEKLQSALLNSISHDLRTPLATITGALSSLRDDRGLLGEAAQRDLLASAHEEAERLNHLVGNLLDMTRLESGAMHISAELADVEDVIGVALAQLSKRLQRRQIIIEVPPDLPLVPLDFVLAVQIFVNLLDNADKYSPPHTPIRIRAWSTENELLVEVADRGPGIAAAELERIFDKFFRGQSGDRVAGTGLGLSIGKGIIAAHEGHIWARNRQKGGAALTVAFPLHSHHQRLLERNQ